LGMSRPGGGRGLRPETGMLAGLKSCVAPLLVLTVDERERRPARMDERSESIISHKAFAHCGGRLKWDYDRQAICIIRLDTGYCLKSDILEVCMLGAGCYR
jgi:hypothetical protein